MLLAEIAPVDVLADVPKPTLFCRFILVNKLCGVSSIPLLSTLQYSRVLLAPGVVMRGCPSVATDFVGPF